MDINGEKSLVVGYLWSKSRSAFMSNKAFARKRPFMYKKPIITDIDISHSIIKELLSGDKPAMIARIGGSEVTVTGKCLLKRNHGILVNNTSIMKQGNWMYNTAGFFSKNGERLLSDLDRFSLLMAEDAKLVDLYGIHYALMEDYVVNKYCTNARFVEMDNFRIMICENSWGEALREKKVLVIYPCAKTIQSQYARRDKIWSNPTILPDFTLITYQPVQTIAGNNIDQYIDWFDALEKMKKDISQIDFDIAIIGCGAYGFPLAAECKRLGKKAIHLGGQTQMCFGVLGKRWEDIPYYQQFINEYWVHPSEEETPKNYKAVENGCYW